MQHAILALVDVALPSIEKKPVEEDTAKPQDAQAAQIADTCSRDEAGVVIDFDSDHEQEGSLLVTMTSFWIVLEIEAAGSGVFSGLVMTSGGSEQGSEPGHAACESIYLVTVPARNGHIARYVREEHLKSAATAPKFNRLAYSVLLGDCLAHILQHCAIRAREHC